MWQLRRSSSGNMTEAAAKCEVFQNAWAPFVLRLSSALQASLPKVAITVVALGRALPPTFPFLPSHCFSFLSKPSAFRSRFVLLLAYGGALLQRYQRSKRITSCCDGIAAPGFTKLLQAHFSGCLVAHSSAIRGALY